MSTRKRRVPGMPVIIVAPEMACEECRWDRIAQAIANAAGKPDEAVAICPKHAKQQQKGRTAG